MASILFYSYHSKDTLRTLDEQNNNIKSRILNEFNDESSIYYTLQYR
jgi:hypothetical protein